jgi:hypothetical protein
MKWIAIGVVLAMLVIVAGVYIIDHGIVYKF